MTSTVYTVTAEFAAAAAEIANPWFIVNADYVVGVYAGRAKARAAKAEGLAGKVVPQTEVDLKVIALIEESKPWGFEIHGLIHCPGCGIHLDNGIGSHLQDVNGKLIKHEKFEYCCLSCGAEFGPAITVTVEKKIAAKGKPIEHHSTTERPCKLVWQLADDMPGARRKDVIAKAQEMGVAYYTARTQYQLWLQVQKEMAERVAATAAAAASKK